MMASTRLNGDAPTPPNRRQRGSPIRHSISDPAHHVTETITTMYEDDLEDSPSLSTADDPILGSLASNRGSSSRRSPIRTSKPQDHAHRSTLSPIKTSARAEAESHSNPPPLSPSRRDVGQAERDTLGGFAGSARAKSNSFREVEDTSGVPEFPLTNIENPNDIAQELSNLQALRRMSMDVGNATTDPDFMFASNTLMSVSTSPHDEDDGLDPSKLLWVPASVHPELAPMEFKSFLERRVTALKRRSSESNTLLVPGAEKWEHGHGGSLHRKKSMLSRQIDRTTGDGYVDGAERLGGKRVGNGGHQLTVQDMTTDPAGAVLQQQQEQQQQSESTHAASLPTFPKGPPAGLRRSTRTTYRKGNSLRSSKEPRRGTHIKPYEAEAEPAVPPLPANVDLTAAPSGPAVSANKPVVEPVLENFSRPSSRTVRRQQGFRQDASTSPSNASEPAVEETPPGDSQPQPSSLALQTSQSLPLRTSSMTSVRTAPVHATSSTDATQAASEPEYPGSSHQPPQSYPRRSSSQTSTSTMSTPHLGSDEAVLRLSKQELRNKTSSHQLASQVSSEHPTPDSIHRSLVLPACSSTRTDALTFIPTFTPDERKDKKNRRQKDDESESPSGSKSSWKWFKSSGESKDKKRSQLSYEEERKQRSRILAEKSQDNVNYDVTNKASGKGRESFVGDRDSIDVKLTQERRKETAKKGGETKKEKDGLFASIFGSGKKKHDKETGKKHHQPRINAYSPEPSSHALIPDVHYNWSRFPIVKERAIYRLAHMKLANPRRSLHSQVLLSNFMYSYLAKVQAMHPQIQVPMSPKQKRLEEERRRKEEEEQKARHQLLVEQMHREEDEQGDLDNSHGYEYPEHEYGEHRSEEHDNEYDHGGLQYEQDPSYTDENTNAYGYGNGHTQHTSHEYSYGHEDDSVHHPAQQRR